MTNDYITKNKFPIALDNLLNGLLVELQFSTRKIASEVQINEKNLSKWRNGVTQPKYDDTRILLEYSLIIKQLPYSYNIQKLATEFEHACYERLYDLDPDRLLKEAIVQDTRDFLKEQTSIIFNVTENSPAFDDDKIQMFYDKMIDANILDMTLGEQSFYLPPNVTLTKKIASKYRKQFTHNFKIFIEVLDALVNLDVEDIIESPLIPNWLPDKKKDFINNVKQLVNYSSETNHKKRTAVQSWLAESLDVSPSQISNWKSGKDFPTMYNLQNLQKVLGFRGELGLIGYNMDTDMCISQLHGLFYAT